MLVALFKAAKRVALARSRVHSEFSRTSPNRFVVELSRIRSERRHARAVPLLCGSSQDQRWHRYLEAILKRQKDGVLEG